MFYNNHKAKMEFPKKSMHTLQHVSTYNNFTRNVQLFKVWLTFCLQIKKLKYYILKYNFDLKITFWKYNLIWKSYLGFMD